MMSATYSLRRPLGHANCETDRRRMRPSSAATSTEPCSRGRGGSMCRSSAISPASCQPRSANVTSTVNFWSSQTRSSSFCIEMRVRASIAPSGSSNASMRDRLTRRGRAPRTASVRRKGPRAIRRGGPIDPYSRLARSAMSRSSVVRLKCPRVVSAINSAYRDVPRICSRVMPRSNLTAGLSQPNRCRPRLRAHQHRRVGKIVWLRTREGAYIVHSRVN